MSDSTNPLNQVSQSAIQREVTINENFAQTSPAAIFAYNAVTSAALTWGYMGGRLDGTAVASGTVALTDNTSNYIVAHRTTLAVTVSTATTNWNNTTTYGRLYKVTTSGGVVVPSTGAEDHRAGGIFVGGGGGVGLSDGDKGDITVSSSGTVWTIDADVVTVAKMHASATNVFFGRDTTGSGAGEEISASAAAAILGTNVKSTESLIVACSDESTALTSSGNPKVTFRMPYAFTLTAVRASLTTAQASGSIFTVDINEGTTILSTKITITNTEKTSTTAGTPPVISDASLADDAEITVDIDQVGDGTAKGLKIYLIGNRT